MAEYNIVQGDNGTLLNFTVTDENGVVILTDIISIEATITTGERRVTKVCNITDAVLGKCQAVLTSEDVATNGTYIVQITVKFIDGKIFSSTKGKFMVDKKI